MLLQLRNDSNPKFGFTNNKPNHNLLVVFCLPSSVLAVGPTTVIDLNSNAYLCAWKHACTPCVHTHSHMYLSMFVYMRTGLRACILTCILACICAHASFQKYSNMYARTHTCMHVYVHI